MEYLHLFNTKSEHDSLRNGDNYKEPWLAYVRDNSLVTGNKGWSEKYLTFEALESGTFTFTMENKLSTACVESVSYSIDDGETWITVNNIDGEAVTLTTPTISEGNKVLWKGVGVQYCSNTDPYPGSNFGQGYFSSTGRFNISGNIMSMLFGDNFIDKVEFPERITTGYGAGAFSYLFGHLNPQLRNCGIVSAKNFILPATTLTDYCYSNMFIGCTALTAAPELPATTLTDYCYSNMFIGCTALTAAPELPATTLTTNCYSYMFYGCTSLTTAPVLPATTLTTNCYSYMFYGCTLLNYIKAMFTTTPSTTYTQNWVSGVASTGTFIKNSAATWNVTGVNGIPSGWTVQTASA